MRPVSVALPVFRTSRKFHIDKGRPWSVIEHLTLSSLAQKPTTVAALSRAGNMHQRLVIESIVRLMRAGWVELSHGSDGVVFRASPLGLVAADADNLPAPTKRIFRWMSFVVDRVSGTVYRRREFTLLEKHAVRERAQREPLVWMEPVDVVHGDDVGSVLSTLLDEDEQFVGIELSGSRSAERYVVLTVRDGHVEGLPPRAPADLARLVTDAAATASPVATGSHSPSYYPNASPDPELARAPAPRTASFQVSDIIMGGDDHRDALTQTLRRARQRVLIHSTFIRQDAFDLWRPLMLDAVQRGVLIDILWGQDARTSLATTRDVVRKLRAEIEERGLGASLRIHPFSTRSHAKLLVADEGQRGLTTAIVGSCNWLNRGFDSFEVSLRLRDPAFVSEVIFQVADLSRGADRQWTDLTSDLATWAVSAKAQPPPSSGAKAQVGLVIGPEHGHFMRRARDEAEKRLFVTSHRFGAAAGSVVVPPAIAAVRDRGVVAHIYYGMVNPEIPGGAAGMVSEAAREGVRIQCVHEPRLHAKLLAWDDDHLLVTSRNWLSADTSESNPRQEIGIYVQARGAARLVIERFAVLRNFS